jgi:hypothetical protein
MKTSIKILQWTPRILCILAILFISMFAADVFAAGLTFWRQIGDFLMHLIPSFILLGVLVIAWKWERIGGIILSVIGIGLIPFIFHHNYNMNHSIGMSLLVILIINFPFIIAGALFILSYYVKKKNLIN